MKKDFSEKQIHILEVAEELIAQKGYDGTSIRDISSKANINVAMVSYYFGSKEQMMFSLYQYRLSRNRQHFAGFAETIKNGKPEMQMKEIIKYIIGQLFKYNYFHAFVAQELRNNEPLKNELLEFYNTCVAIIDDVVKKGIVTGVFTYAPKSEDILSIILGTSLFTIRNKNFYELFIRSETDKEFLEEAEKKVKSNLLLSIFMLLGYTKE